MNRIEELEAELARAQARIDLAYRTMGKDLDAAKARIAELEAITEGQELALESKRQQCEVLEAKLWGMLAVLDRILTEDAQQALSGLVTTTAAQGVPAPEAAAAEPDEISEEEMEALLDQLVRDGLVDRQIGSNGEKSYCLNEAGKGNVEELLARHGLRHLIRGRA